MRRIDFRRNDGVAMTEFALVLPVFVLIIVGLLSFGRVLYYWIETNHVASETARWAIVDQNPFTGQTLQEHAAQSLDGRVRKRRQGLHLSPGRGASRREARGARFRSPSRFVPVLNAGTITIRGTSTMRIENFNGTNGAPPTAYAAGDYKGRACT